MRFRAAVIAGATTMLVASAVFAAPAPRLKAKSLSDLGSDLPYPYHSDADAVRAVAAAKMRAAASGKLLLVDLGGNWCPDCRILSGVMDLPVLKAFVDAYYVLVVVDVGLIDKNLQIPAHYGVGKKQLPAVPALLVVDPRTDTLLNKGDVEALVGAHGMTPQAIADWLAKWTSRGQSS